MSPPMTRFTSGSGSRSPATVRPPKQVNERPGASGTAALPKSGEQTYADLTLFGAPYRPEMYAMSTEQQKRNKQVAETYRQLRIEFRENLFRRTIAKFTENVLKLTAESVDSEEVGKFLKACENLDYPAAPKFPCPFTFESSLQTDCHGHEFPEIGQLLQHIRRKHAPPGAIVTKAKLATPNSQSNKESLIHGNPQNARPCPSNETLETTKEKAHVDPRVILTQQGLIGLKSLSGGLRQRKLETKCTVQSCRYFGKKQPGNNDNKIKTDTLVPCCKQCSEFRLRRYEFICEKLLGKERLHLFKSKRASADWARIHEAPHMPHDTEIMDLAIQMANDYIQREEVKQQAAHDDNNLFPDDLVRMTSGFEDDRLLDGIYGNDTDLTNITVMPTSLSLNPPMVPSPQVQPRLLYTRPSSQSMRNHPNNKRPATGTCIERTPKRVTRAPTPSIHTSDIPLDMPVSDEFSSFENAFFDEYGLFLDLDKDLGKDEERARLEAQKIQENALRSQQVHAISSNPTAPTLLAAGTMDQSIVSMDQWPMETFTGSFDNLETPELPQLQQQLRRPLHSVRNVNAVEWDVGSGPGPGSGLGRQQAGARQGLMLPSAGQRMGGGRRI